MTPGMITLGFMPFFTFALGSWQVDRLKWKVNLIDELEEKLRREPMVLPPRINVSVLPNFIYRKVVMRGKWDHQHTVLIGPRVRDGTSGYHLITPLIRSDGSTVLVDRGFISQEFADVAKRPKDSDLEVEVKGMLRTSQVRNAFTPDNHPEKGEWFWVDVDALAEYAGGEKAGVQPVFIEELFEGHSGDATRRLKQGIAIGKTPIVEVRNSHMSYVVTWYSLSAFTTFMFLRLLGKQRRSHARLPR